MGPLQSGGGGVFLASGFWGWPQRRWVGQSPQGPPAGELLRSWQGSVLTGMAIPSQPPPWSLPPLPEKWSGEPPLGAEPSLPLEGPGRNLVIWLPFCLSPQHFTPARLPSRACHSAPIFPFANPLGKFFQKAAMFLFRGSPCQDPQAGECSWKEGGRGEFGRRRGGQWGGSPPSPFAANKLGF